MTYTFPVEQHGTFWFHSHVGSQYTEGIRGPVIVYPERDVYEYDAEFTITLSEWYHRSYQENEEWYLSPESHGSPPYPDSILLNNHGQYDCDYAKRKNMSCTRLQQYRPVFTLERNKVYRMRVINMGGWATFEVSVDNHKLEAIEVDGIDVKKLDAVDGAFIGSGQRYSFLLRRLEFEKNEFTIRAKLKKDYLFLDPKVKNINPFPEALREEVTGVIKYVDFSVNDYDVRAEIERFTYRSRDDEVPLGRRKVYLNDSYLRPVDGSTAPNIFHVEKILTIGFGNDQEGIRRGYFNDVPFHLPEEKPLLLQVLDGGDLPNYYPSVKAEYGDVVQLVINNPLLGAHPIHVHGHHFFVVVSGKEGEGDYDMNRHSVTLDGAMRDTAMVKEKSHLVIRFKAENPGVWAVHCHIDWHAQSGMMVVIEEAVSMARRTLRITESAKQVCRDHGIMV